MKSINELVVYLEANSRPSQRHFGITPVTVTIDGESWPACRYNTELFYNETMDAVRWGQNKAGDPYYSDHFFCIGGLPKCFVGNRRDKHPAGKVCFPFEGLDWYVACYMRASKITPANQEHHPFGETFILMPWNIPKSKIDEHQPKPYRRFQLNVTPLPPCPTSTALIALPN